MGEFRKRRQDLIARLKDEAYFKKSSLVLFFSSYELGSQAFQQDSTFWYYSGCNEPGSILTIDSTGFTTLYIAYMANDRSIWSSDVVQKNAEWEALLDVDAIEYAGMPFNAHFVSPLWRSDSMINVINAINDVLQENANILTLAQEFGSHNIQARMALSRMQFFVPSLCEGIADISYIVGEQRRQKSLFELSSMINAVDITLKAHDAAALAIKDGATELEVCAVLEYEIKVRGAGLAFESIVASGDKSTVLHHHPSLKTMSTGDLVVIDIGARINGYCADISRTHVVGNRLSARQRYVYDIVNACQMYIASCVRPGIFLRNAKKPDESLHHIAIRFFAEYNLSEYFSHSIGHYLGLDVHDVGDYVLPLREGDIITIEPGIYIPQESIGIRVEDDFYVSAEGARSLSSLKLL